MLRLCDLSTDKALERQPHRREAFLIHGMNLCLHAEL